MCVLMARQRAQRQALLVVLVRQQQPARNPTGKDRIRNIEEFSSRRGPEEALPLVVAAGAGGCAGAARVPSQRVVHLLPQLLRRHLQERNILHFIHGHFNP